jgi:chromosome segregation ATPase
MTLQDLEHRLENVEAQHATYVTVLSNHTAAIAGLTAAVITIGARLDRIEQTLATLVAEMAFVKSNIAALKEGQERLEAFLRQKFNGK